MHAPLGFLRTRELAGAMGDRPPASEATPANTLIRIEGCERPILIIDAIIKNIPIILLENGNWSKLPCYMYELGLGLGAEGSIAPDLGLSR